MLDTTPIEKQVAAISDAAAGFGYLAGIACRKAIEAMNEFAAACGRIDWPDLDFAVTTAEDKEGAVDESVH